MKRLISSRHVFLTSGYGSYSRKVRERGCDNTKVIKQKVHVDMSEVKEAKKQIRRLYRLLKEANSLAGELASKKIRINVYM